MVRLRCKTRGENPWRVWGQRPGQPEGRFSSFFIVENLQRVDFPEFYPQLAKINKLSHNLLAEEKFLNIYTLQKLLKINDFAKNEAKIDA